MELLLGIAVTFALFGFLTGLCVSSTNLASQKFYYRQFRQFSDVQCAAALYCCFCFLTIRLIDRALR